MQNKPIIKDVYYLYGILNSYSYNLSSKHIENNNKIIPSLRKINNKRVITKEKPQAFFKDCGIIVVY